MTGRPPSVSTLGEAMLRLSVSAGERLEDASGYEVHVAGAEANVAFALARVGVAARWTSALPRNALGSRVASTLSAGGVDVASVHWVDGARLGTYFVEFSPFPRPSKVVYDRVDSASARATVADFDWDRVLDATAFHISGISFALSESAGAVARHAVTEARRRGLFVSFDINYRRRLWSPEEAAAALREIAPQLDLVVCAAKDASLLFGLEGATREIAARLREELRVDSVVVTNGATGAASASAGGSLEQPAFDVQVIDRIGAGDAFAAGLLWGLLAEESMHCGLQRGAAMAALKMTLRGDLFRLGPEEVSALQDGYTVEIDR
jgi:2-dehydro-3-deoxygluconokinase